MESIESIVMKLERELLEPAVRADTQRLDALLADDFLEVGAAGELFTKSEVLARLPSENGVAISTSAMQAYLLAPSVMLVTYAAQRSHAGKTTRSLRSSVWIKNTRGWQMRYHQGTYEHAA
jgi:hypothetical protein